MPDLLKTNTNLMNKRIINHDKTNPEDESNLNGSPAGYSLKDSKIIFFTGLTGGCGCSFITNCISAYCAKTKNKNILLIDLQTGKKDSRIIFNIAGDHVRDLGDIRCNYSEIDLPVLKKLIINHDSSLNIILPSLKFEKAEILQNDKLEILLEILSSYFDLILVDLPYYHFLNGQSSLIDRVDRIIFISQADQLSVHNLENFISNLSCQCASLKFEIVINKFNLKMVVSPARIMNTIRFPVKTFIPYDKDIEYLYLVRGPFAVFDYSLRTVMALRDLAEMLYEELFV